jgi:glycosyltransferase involved in cell wall biosynthesis
MLVHDAKLKGTELGLDALNRVREKLGDLEIRLYGATRPSIPLPSGAVFHQNLTGKDVEEYFNDLAIFVHPSLIEGWPLPPAEAMACGAAVVAADNQGVLDYAVDGVNSVVVPRGSAEALANAIESLILDPDRRIALARTAERQIQAYGLSRAADRFEEVLRTICATAHS